MVSSRAQEHFPLYLYFSLAVLILLLQNEKGKQRRRRSKFTRTVDLGKVCSCALQNPNNENSAYIENTFGAPSFPTIINSSQSSQFVWKETNSKVAGSKYLSLSFPSFLSNDLTNSKTLPFNRTGQ